MKYEGFKESTHIKIKNSNLNDFIEFKYGIEQYNVGKNIHAAFVRKFIKSVFNNFFNSQVSYVYYKNNKNYSSIYSKNWWNF